MYALVVAREPVKKQANEKFILNPEVANKNVSNTNNIHIIILKFQMKV
jgi:hypothetical protein